MRLNAYLARAGVASRRGADKLILAGRVTVNGSPGQLNDQVNEASKIEVDGKPIHAQRLRYMLLYKPERTVTTLSDPEGRPTILDDVKVPERVVPVGRLDFDTTGVLLLTNDGAWAHQLMHPSFEIDKVYEAAIEGRATPEILNKLNNGVELNGRKTAPAKIRKLSADKLELTIHEGRYHQVKRMLEAVGLSVKKLHRSQYGPLNLDGLRPGQWRDLTKTEIEALQK
jgi:23S rRNA pseudouridine2605 synthase